MQKFKRSYRIAEKLNRLTPEEIKEVMKETTYTGTCAKIEEILKRKGGDQKSS